MVHHQKALDYFKNLYLTAIADRKLAYEETSFLVQVAQQMGITSREASEIMFGNAEQEMTIPDTEQEKLTQLEDIVVMMMIDRKIHEREYNLCLTFAKTIGISQHNLDRLILKVIKNE
jgi:uncharacterized tellurite resistance protein B-like protein